MTPCQQNIPVFIIKYNENKCLLNIQQLKTTGLTYGLKKRFHPLPVDFDFDVPLQFMKYCYSVNFCCYIRLTNIYRQDTKDLINSEIYIE